MLGEEEVTLPELPEGYTAVKTDALMMLIEQNTVMKEEISTLVGVCTHILPAVKGKGMNAAIVSISKMVMSGNFAQLMDPLMPIIDKYAQQYADENTETAG